MVSECLFSTESLYEFSSESLSEILSETLTEAQRVSSAHKVSNVLRWRGPATSMPVTGKPGTASSSFVFQ